MYTFIDKLFIMLLFFMYLTISPILFISIPSDELYQNKIQPIIISIFLSYLFVMYTMVGSDCVLKKTLGYGLGVGPLIILSSFVEP